jgi:hypothetical protein
MLDDNPAVPFCHGVTDMPAPVSLTLRRRIRTRLQQGRHPADIAYELRLSCRTVRRLCQRFREQGEAALQPVYRRPTPAKPSTALEQALFLHEQHPTWGAPYILLQLQDLHPDLGLPSARTVQRYCRARRQPLAPPGRKAAAARLCAKRPHEIWQMDAVEQCALQGGQKISWLRWVDEYTGAVLGTVVFPLRHLRPSACNRGGQRAAPAISAVGHA